MGMMFSKKRASSVGIALGAGALAKVMATGTASATEIPGFLNSVKVGGGTRTVYTGHTEMNQTDLKGCPSNAWIEGHATWTLGAVSKTSIVVRKIQLFYRAGVKSTGGAQLMLRGNGSSVYGTYWTAGDIPGDYRDRSMTYTLNKTVPLDLRSVIIFRSYFSLGRTGGPA